MPTANAITAKPSSAVRDFRKALKLSQTAFANRLKVSLPTIQRWETVREPGPEALLLLIRLAAVEPNAKKHRKIFEAMLAEFGFIAIVEPEHSPHVSG